MLKNPWINSWIRIQTGREGEGRKEIGEGRGKGKGEEKGREGENSPQTFLSGLVPV